MHICSLNTIGILGSFPNFKASHFWQCTYGNSQFLNKLKKLVKVASLSVTFEWYNMSTSSKWFCTRNSNNLKLGPKDLQNKRKNVLPTYALGFINSYPQSKHIISSYTFSISQPTAKFSNTVNHGSVLPMPTKTSLSTGNCLWDTFG